MLDAVKPVLQCLVGVDREVGRYYGETRFILDVQFEEIADAPTVVVIPDARAFRLNRHSLRKSAMGTGSCLRTCGTHFSFSRF